MIQELSLCPAELRVLMADDIFFFFQFNTTTNTLGSIYYKIYIQDINIEMNKVLQFSFHRFFSFSFCCFHFAFRFHSNVIIETKIINNNHNKLHTGVQVVNRSLQTLPVRKSGRKSTTTGRTYHFSS